MPLDFAAPTMNVFLDGFEPSGDTLVTSAIISTRANIMRLPIDIQPRAIGATAKSPVVVEQLNPDQAFLASRRIDRQSLAW